MTLVRAQTLCLVFCGRRSVYQWITEHASYIFKKITHFSTLQLLVPLWSIPRLPMQQLAPHWEFAGVSSQMTLWSATSCAINQWAMRGTVMNKQVKETEKQGDSSVPADKTTGSKVLLDFAMATSAPSTATLCYQHMCHHISSFWLCHSSAARSAMLSAAAGPITEAKTGLGEQLG